MEYNDFAVLEPDKFMEVAKEYSKVGGGETLSVEKINRTRKFQEETSYKESLQSKVNYLLKLTDDLIDSTKNADAIEVLTENKKRIETERENIIILFELGIEAQSVSSLNIERFCNNLKLALQVTAEIVQLLVMAKDDETTAGEAKLKLTEIINGFIVINNNFVSLFGECRHRTFSLFRQNKNR